MRLIPLYLPTAALVALQVGCTSATTETGASVEPRVNPVGLYEWRDQLNEPTGCLIRIFRAAGRYQGWILEDLEDQRGCPLRDVAFRDIRVSGSHVTMRVDCSAMLCAEFRLEAVSDTRLEGYLGRAAERVTLILRR